MRIQRGDVWWADLGEPIGSAPGYRRPVVILQRDEVNRSRLKTVTVVPITGNRALADAPGNVLVPAGSCGLAEDSVANVSLVVTLDRTQLDRRLGACPRALVGQVAAGVAWFLGLTGS